MSPISGKWLGEGEVIQTLEESTAQWPGVIEGREATESVETFTQTIKGGIYNITRFWHDPNSVEGDYLDDYVGYFRPEEGQTSLTGSQQGDTAVLDQVDRDSEGFKDGKSDGFQMENAGKDHFSSMLKVLSEGEETQSQDLSDMLTDFYENGIEGAFIHPSPITLGDSELVQIQALEAEKTTKKKPKALKQQPTEEGYKILIFSKGKTKLPDGDEVNISYGLTVRKNFQRGLGLKKEKVGKEKVLSLVQDLVDPDSREGMLYPEDYWTRPKDAADVKGVGVAGMWGDKLFSIAPDSDRGISEVSADHIKNVVSAFKKSFRGSALLDFEVFDNAESAEAAGYKGVNPDARGFYENGKVVLLANNIRNTDTARAVLFHESIGHYGVKEMMGDEAFSVMLDRIVKENRLEIQT